MTLIAYVFPKLRTPKKGLEICVKNSVSEGPSTSNIVNGPKHCCNLDDGTFTLLIDHCEHNSVRKSLFKCYQKS